jgi:hypothetical protein
MTSYRIVRRAFSTYTDIESVEGTYCDATLRAMALEFLNADGEYLVRAPGEPDQRLGGSAVQSGFDFL